MKELLRYYYNLEKPIIYRDKKIIKVKSQNRTYIIQPIKNINELNEIIKLIKNMEINKCFYNIIQTNEKKYTFDYQNIHYILLETKKCSKEKNNKNIEGEYKFIDKSNWSQLWRIKIDNVRTKKFNNYIEQSIVDYYIGLAECGLKYLNYAKFPSKKEISYMRLKNIDENNPVNVIIDVPERLIAEEIKCGIETEKNESIKSTIDNNRVVARLLFYGEFFDKVLNDESIDITIEINKLKDVEKIVSTFIGKTFNIKNIDWL